MNKVISFAMSLVLLLASQVYAWDQACMDMKVGIWYAGWTHVDVKDKNGKEEYELNGPQKTVGNTSCVDISSVGLNSIITVSVHDIFNGAVCRQQPIIEQNNWPCELKFEASGGLFREHCSFLNQRTLNECTKRAR